VKQPWILAAVIFALHLPLDVGQAGFPDDDGAIRLTFSDQEHAVPESGLHAEPRPIEHVQYPNCVSHEPGWPRKPLRERPGDINNKDCPADRYCENDHARSGCPEQVAWWAKCAVNQNYSAWFVGGGTPWIYPRQGRARTEEEGTWGMDYDGLFRPRRVWMNWSCGRVQGGLGAYETDGAPAIVEKLKLH
jgi:hypothetical protein